MSSKGKHKEDRSRRTGSSSHSKYDSACKSESHFFITCGSAGQGCFHTRDEILSAFRLKIEPYPEPDYTDEALHSQWREDYKSWRHCTCPCRRGYFCRPHGEYISAHVLSDLSDSTAKEKDEMGRSMCLHDYNAYHQSGQSTGQSLDRNETTASAVSGYGDDPGSTYSGSTYYGSPQLEGVTSKTSSSRYKSSSSKKHHAREPESTTGTFDLPSRPATLEDPYSYKTVSYSGDQSHNSYERGYGSHTDPDAYVPGSYAAPDVYYSSHDTYSSSSIAQSTPVASTSEHPYDDDEYQQNYSTHVRSKHHKGHHYSRTTR